MLVQLPRLSSSLRQPFDVDQAYLHRKSIQHNLLFKFNPDDQRTSLGVDAYEIQGDENAEFGWDIPFREPGRFSIDVSSVDSNQLLGEVAPRPSNVNNNLNEKQLHTSVDGGAVDLKWLQDACDSIVKSSTSQLPSDELAMAICRVLDSDKAGDEVNFFSDVFVLKFGALHLVNANSSLCNPNIHDMKFTFPHSSSIVIKIAGDLLDLAGDTAFETVQHLLQHRKQLVESYRHGLAVLKSDKMASNSQPRMPSYGTQVTVQTESERQIDKLRRKEERKERRGMEFGLDTDITGTSFSSLVNASSRNNHLDDVIGTGNGPAAFSVTALPQGTLRKHHKGYEEVIIPPTPAAQMKPGEKLIEIKELDEFAQAAFHGYKTLNRIQSRIYNTTYHTNENILVCAPTGAGKTNIAMIAILHELTRFSGYNILFNWIPLESALGVTLGIQKNPFSVRALYDSLADRAIFEFFRTE